MVLLAAFFFFFFFFFSTLNLFSSVGEACTVLYYFRDCAFLHCRGVKKGTEG